MALSEKRGIKESVIHTGRGQWQAHLRDKASGLLDWTGL